MERHGWMVRAGERGRLIEAFEKGYVAVGMPVGDVSNVTTLEAMRAAMQDAELRIDRAALGNATAMIHKFRNVIAIDDLVVTYDKSRREYLVGTIRGEYAFSPGTVGDYEHVRAVEWERRISRDDLSATSRNSLGSTLTLFSLNEDVMQELLRTSGQQTARTAEAEEAEHQALEEIREDTVERAKELIKDRVLKLSPSQMERLMAAVLRALGYRTRVSPEGPDRGVDVLASPDGLGLEAPRIKAEVKHRPNTPMGSQQIRSFIGGLREADRGLYLSTGGFTKDAGYEAERSNVPVALLDLDQLVELIVSHYESFDVEGRTLVPLVRLYWPAD